ncbi:hypothetical protein J6590_081561 [Homalodisca vitripennis]|nr:hypothetical protein J6590_081561 [Homalodisca vitripennis]
MGIRLTKQKPRNKEELRFMVANIWRQITKAVCLNSLTPCRTGVHFLNYKAAALLVLVRPGYFISPVPAISGEHSPIHHPGRRPMGD